MRQSRPVSLNTYSVSPAGALAALRTRLEQLYDDYNREDAAADPIQIVKR